jgi:hypothetical protein
MARHLEILTNSSRLQYQNCNRFYYLRNIVQVVAKAERDAFMFGSACHGWLDYWWMDRIGFPVPIFEDPYQDAKYRAMTLGYGLRWSDWAVDHTSEVQSEMEFLIPLINPDTGAASTFWEVGGKLDKYLKIDGVPYIQEHKTSRETVPGYFERLRMCSQISTYLMAVKAMKLEEPAGVLYDVLKKPAIKPLLATPENKRKYTKDGKLYAAQRDTDETPDEYYQRCLATIGEHPEEYYQHYEVVRLESEVRESAANLWHIGAQIRQSMHDNRWPQNPDNCRSEFGFYCDYWPICTGKSTPEDSTLYEHRRPHSELSENHGN